MKNIMNRKKQFIAGAICPECSEMDSLVLYTDDQSVACVSCNYTKSSQQRDRETKLTVARKDLDDSKSSLKNNTNTAYKDASLIKITNLDK